MDDSIERDRIIADAAGGVKLHRNMEFLALLLRLTFGLLKAVSSNDLERGGSDAPPRPTTLEGREA